MTGGSLRSPAAYAVLEVMIVDRALLVAILSILVDGLKRKGLKDDHAPFVSMGLGIILNLVNIYVFDEVNAWRAVLDGIIIGLAAVGLYNGSRVVTRTVKAYLYESRK